MKSPRREHGLGPYADSLPLRLLRAREAVMARIRPMLRAHGLSEQHWRILRTLAPETELEMTQLAHRVYMHPPSVTRMLSAMQEQGIATRRPSEHDGRRILVSITPKGRDVIATITPEAAAIAADIEWRFGGDRAARLRRLLEELEEALLSEDIE
jgi:homoprotocatechuate degradation regulator HpaR